MSAPQVGSISPAAAGGDIAAPSKVAKPVTASVVKALRILEAFGDADRPLGASELSRKVGLPKTTVFRALASLEHAGFMARIGTKYKLSRRMQELGTSLDDHQPQRLRNLALPFLSELFVASSGRTVHMAVLDGANILYLEKIHRHAAPNIPSSIGGRIPANCSALGKALLAYSTGESLREYLERPLARRTRYSISEPGRLVNQLRQVRQTGEAYDREESTLGLTCVAAPIMQHGRPVAAISISAPTTAFSPIVHNRLLQKTAQDISGALTGKESVHH